MQNDSQEDTTVYANRVYTPHNGQIFFNSYSKLETRDDALAAWWASAKCQNPVTTLIYDGIDGYAKSDDLIGKEIPERLKEKVALFVKEYDDAEIDAAAEQERQSRDWAI